jgi:hypothetical protein
MRLYYRRRIGGPKIRLRAEPGTAEFAAEYEAAQAHSNDGLSERPTELKRPEKGTLGWLCAVYMRSAEFSRLAERTQMARRRLLDKIIVEPVAPEKRETFADFPLARLTAKLYVFSVIVRGMYRKLRMIG